MSSCNWCERRHSYDSCDEPPSRNIDGNGYIPLTSLLAITLTSIIELYEQIQLVKNKCHNQLQQHLQPPFSNRCFIFNMFHRRRGVGRASAAQRAASSRGAEVRLAWRRRGALQFPWENHGRTQEKSMVNRCSKEV